MLDRINARFRDGWAEGGDDADDLALAQTGVLVHQFDTIDEQNPARADKADTWLLSVEKPQWADRISATLINARIRPAGTQIPLFSDVQSGVVFNPDVVRVLCGFSKDGGTQTDRVCSPPGVSERCLPGCSYRGKLTWCDGWYKTPCAWRPKQLGKMLQAQQAMHETSPTGRFNEVIVDAAHFGRHLPSAVEAIFFVGTDSSEHCHSQNHWANVQGGKRVNHCEGYARVAHRAFLRTHGLTEEEVPLLRLDLFTETDAPFRLADAPMSVSGTGEVIEAVCLSDLRASRVEGNGRAPQLWVYEGQGSFETVQRTRSAVGGGAEPRWAGESACVSLLPRSDGRTCFDIRDANVQGRRPVTECCDALLHFGCVTLTADLVDTQLSVELSEYSIDNKPKATLHMTVRRALPPPPAPPTPPPTPPAPPVPPPAACTAATSAWCGRFSSWLDDLEGAGAKFASLWGATAWRLRGRGEQGCWHQQGGRQFFADVLAGTRCDRNWYEGAARQPNFKSPGAPALLGFDSTIWQLCSQESGHAGELGGFSQERLASRCIASSNNILRVVGGEWKWDMCQNLAWQLCAATGKLPGQRGKSLRFATAPRQLTLSEWERPTSWPCEGGRCPNGKFAVGDVFYVEIAVYRAICANAGDLFGVGVGEPLECDVDAAAFDRLAERLMATDE